MIPRKMQVLSFNLLGTSGFKSTVNCKAKIESSSALVPKTALESPTLATMRSSPYIKESIIRLMIISIDHGRFCHELYKCTISLFLTDDLCNRLEQTFKTTTTLKE